MSDEPTTTEDTGEETPTTGEASERRSRRDRSKGADGGNGQPPRRELEQAPALLKKSSVILTCGALIPWMTSISTKGHMPWAHWFIGILLTVAAAWVLFDHANAKAGAKASGISKTLQNAHPMAASGVSVALFVAAAIVAISANVYFYEGGVFIGSVRPETEEVIKETYSIRAILELGTLYLALATFAHIHDYEYGHRFNPIFPLMFLGPAVAGSLHVLTAAADIGDYPLALVGALGSIVVAAGGIMAMYTMYVTMKVAKAEGDMKKAAQREQRRSERTSRKGS